MKKSVILVFLVAASACSFFQKGKSTVISGKITVADSIDASKDYSGTDFIVLLRDTSAVADTLMKARTGKDGSFKGKVRFQKQGRYPVEIRRFGRLLSSYSILLGTDKEVVVTAELPGFIQTAKVVSGEQEAYETYQRLNKNYDRIAAVARAGKLPADTIPDIVRMWSGLYMEVYEQRRGTYASKLSAAEAIRLAGGLGDSLLLRLVDRIKTEPMLGQIAGTAGAGARARVYGLDSALYFLDTLEKLHTDRDDRGSFLRLKVEMLADSGRIPEALQILEKAGSFDRDWKEFSYWRKAVQTDLTTFAPGTPAPDFTVVSGTDSLRLADFAGKLLLIEFVGLANAAYQNQFDQVTGINLVYGANGLTLLTIPIDQNPVLYDGFFQERALQWTFTNPGEFQRAGIETLFNVKSIPSRMLISRDGKIVRKYAGTNFDLLFKDLQKQYAKEIAS